MRQNVPFAASAAKIAVATGLGIAVVAPAHAQLLDPSTLHIGSTSAGGTGTSPNLISTSEFFVTQVSGGDTIVNPPGVFLFFLVPNDGTPPTITNVTEGTAATSVTGALGPTDLTTWTGQDTNILAFLQTTTVSNEIASALSKFTSEESAFDGASLDASIQFATLQSADETDLSTPVTPTNFEVYAAEIPASMVGSTFLDVQGSFANGTFVVPLGFSDSKIYTTSMTNVGDANGVPLTLSVPEPSTWAMLLLGFAGLGYAAFRRKREVPFGSMTA